MQRYLIKFAYAGTRFKGLQSQPGEVIENASDIFRGSIQAILQKGLKRLNPVNEPVISFSSRTDKGVHALCNVAHVDLQRPDGCYTPYSVQSTLNRFLATNNVNLVIREVIPVPEHVSARFCTIHRQYLYRIGVTEEKILPITEWKRCWFFKGPFDPEKAAEACRLFVGTRNLSSFCHKLSEKPEDYRTIRTLDRFDVTEGRPLFDPTYDPSYEKIKFYDFHVKGRSFMQRQIRRMVSAVVHYAGNHLSWDETLKLFEPPYEWSSRINVAPPGGLYLVKAELEYDVDDFKPEVVIEDHLKLAK